MSANNPFAPRGLGLFGALALPRMRRKCFISYHHADETKVQRFITTFDHARDMLISRGLGASMAGDVVQSDNDEYVISRIRQLYLSDSTVTIVMIGNCTWARRYVDWELKASLRSGEKTTPNGLLGIKLPSYSSGQYPHRLNANLLPARRGLLTPDNCYARVVDYPNNTQQLVTAIEDAFAARTARRKYINNSRERYTDDLDCGHYWH